MRITLALSSHFIAHPISLSLSPFRRYRVDLINGKLRAEHIALTHHSLCTANCEKCVRCVFVALLPIPESRHYFTYHNDDRCRCVLRKSSFFLWHFLLCIIFITYYWHALRVACAFDDLFFILCDSRCCPLYHHHIRRLRNRNTMRLHCVFDCPTHADTLSGRIESRTRFSCSGEFARGLCDIFYKFLILVIYFMGDATDCDTTYYVKWTNKELLRIELIEWTQRKNKKCLHKTNENQAFPFTVENYHQNHIPFDMNFWETGTCQVERRKSLVYRSHDSSCSK